MYLSWFLLIASLLSIVFGEVGRFPFGGGSVSVTLVDVFLLLAITFAVIWQIGIKKNLTSFKVLRPLAAFWLVAGVSLIISGNLLGGLYLVRFLLYSSVFWLAYQLASKKIIQLRQLSNIIIIACLLLVTLGFLQMVFLPDLFELTVYGFDPHIDRMVSTFLDPNFLGAFFNIGLLITLLLWIKDRKKVWVFVSLLLVGGIFLTFSRSAYLFLAISILMWGLYKFKKFLLLMIVCALLLYVFYPRFAERINGAINIDRSARERLVSWNNGWQIFKDHPVVGVGFNNLRETLQEYNLVRTYSEDGGHSGAGIDSSLLFVLTTTGLIGLLVYLWFWWQVARFNYPQRHLQFTIIVLIIGLLVESQFINSLFFPPIMLTLYSWLGAAQGEAIALKKIKD